MADEMESFDWIKKMKLQFLKVMIGSKNETEMFLKLLIGSKN